jgi:hypothetical protein
MRYRCPQFLAETLEAIGDDGQFVMTVGCGFMCTLLLVGGYITENTFQTIVLSTVAVFITGRTVTTFSTPKSKANEGAA